MYGGFFFWDNPQFLTYNDGVTFQRKIRNFLLESDHQYWIVSRCILQGMGFIYLMAFLVFFLQGEALLGENGLAPMKEHVRHYLKFSESSLLNFFNVPSIFLFNQSTLFIKLVGLAGVALSIPVMLGRANLLVMAILWVLHVSVANTGGIFWGYGWEIMLAESGFAALFLVPVFSLTSNSLQRPHQRLVVYCFRWMVFRLILGAGLIKLRGDSCWMDLTCLNYHFETQPLPGPLSPWLHQLPLWVKKLGVLFNHFVELICPFFIFGPRKVRLFSGWMIIFFQMALILSGNLLWINHITIVWTLSLFDDRHLKYLFSRFLRKEVISRPTMPRRYHQLALVVYFSIVVLLSYDPIKNLIGPRQVMNRRHDPLMLVNSYGMFGSIGKTRREIVIEGSHDGKKWQAYEFKGKPGQLDAWPGMVAPYHYRIDWQIWFAAMGSINKNPWLVRFVVKLLINDEDSLALIGDHPFEGRAPTFIRMRIFEYRFSREDGNIWQRKLLGPYLPAVSLQNRQLKDYFTSRSWEWPVANQ